MILLNEIAEKLERILNGVDDELSENQRPFNDFYFQVEAQGFQIDHIKLPELGANFIPVFVSSMGGQNNPVKGLKQANYVIPITFYFPVRFKEKMFELGDFLIDVFVGSNLDYGHDTTLDGVTIHTTKRAISNVSIPTFGEIQNLDLQQFQKWVEDIYQRTIGRKNEPFMSMSINLYLSTAADGLIFGNAATVTLKRKDELVAHEIIVDNTSIQSNAQPSSEQELDATIPEGESLPFGTAYGVGFTVYPKFKTYLDTTAQTDNTDWWYNLMQDWCDGKAQEMEFEITISIKIGKKKTLINGVATIVDQVLTFTRFCFLQSVNTPIAPGQLLSVTLSLGKRKEIVIDDDEGE